MIRSANGLITSIIRFCNKHALAGLTVYVALMGVAVWACVAFLTVDTDSSKMLSPKLAFQERTLTLNRQFPTLKNSLVVLIESDTADAADAVARALSERLRKSDQVTDVFAPSVDSFFLENGLLYQSVEELDENLARLNQSASLLAALRQDQSLANFWHSLLTAEKLGAGADFDLSFLDAFYDAVSKTVSARLRGEFHPLSWAEAASPAQNDDDAEGQKNDRVLRFLYAAPVLNFGALQPAKTALFAIDAAVDELDPDLKQVVSIRVTGDPALRFDELKSVSEGIGYSLALSLCLVALILFVAYRTIAHVVLTMIMLMTALCLTAGFAALTFGALNLISVAFVVLLVGLGLDFTIHVLAHLGDDEGASLTDSLSEMGRSIGGALFLSGLTTAVAFLSFAPTDFKGMAQLGVIGAFGVGLAFLLSITLVPALLTLVQWFQPRKKRTKDNASSKQKNNRFPVLLRPLAVTGLLVLTGFAVLKAADVRFDADPIGLRDPSSPSMVALGRLMEKPETAVYRLSLLRDSEEKAVQAAEEVSKLDGIYQVTTLADLVPDDQAEKFELLDFAFPTLETITSGEGLQQVDLPDGVSSLAALRDHLSGLVGRPKARALADLLNDVDAAPSDVRDAIEVDIFRFFPALIETIGAQLKVDTVTTDNIPEALKRRYLATDGTWRVDVVPAGDARNPDVLERFVSTVRAFDANVSGAPMQIVEAGKTVSAAMVQSILVATGFIVLISFFVIRKASTVVAIFLPLLAAGFLTAGASVLFDIPFNYANIIVLPLLIGLGVDSGIHIAMRRSHLEDSSALFNTSTPRAVFFSGVTTIAAFATLSLSAHRGTASMGLMLAIAISATLLSTLILTPFLMDQFARWAKPRN